MINYFKSVFVKNFIVIGIFKRNKMRLLVSYKVLKLWIVKLLIW